MCMLLETERFIPSKTQFFSIGYFSTLQPANSVSFRVIFHPFPLFWYEARLTNTV